MVLKNELFIQKKKKVVAHELREDIQLIEPGTTVRCFYNPICNNFERLDVAHYAPPPFRELHKLHDSKTGHIFPMSRPDAQLLSQNTLRTIEAPIELTSPARLVYNVKTGKTEEPGQLQHQPLRIR